MCETIHSNHPASQSMSFLAAFSVRTDEYFGEGAGILMLAKNQLI